VRNHVEIPIFKTSTLISAVLVLMLAACGSSQTSPKQTSMP